MKKLFALVIGIAFTLGAQEGTNVAVSQGPPFAAYQTLFYSSSSLITYVCQAQSRVVSTITVTAASNANPVSFTATAHNVGDWTNLGATVTPIIKITGGTGGWSVINGIWTMTPTSADAFTIPVNSAALGALTGTLVVTTMSPRHNVRQWSIYHLTYDGSSNITSKGWAQRPTGAGGVSLIGGSTGPGFCLLGESNFGLRVSRPRDMGAASTVPNVTDRRLVDSNVGSNGVVRFSSNKQHLNAPKAIIRYRILVALFGDHVVHVVSMCSKEQVGRINAERVVSARAVMKNMHTIRDFTVRKDPRSTMGILDDASTTPSSLKAAVTFAHCGSSPQPTCRTFLNETPKLSLGVFGVEGIPTFTRTKAAVRLSGWCVARYKRSGAILAGIIERHRWNLQFLGVAGPGLFTQLAAPFHFTPSVI